MHIKTFSWTTCVGDIMQRRFQPCFTLWGRSFHGVLAQGTCFKSSRWRWWRSWEASLGPWMSTAMLLCVTPWITSVITSSDARGRTARHSPHRRQVHPSWAIFCYFAYLSYGFTRIFFSSFETHVVVYASAKWLEPPPNMNSETWSFELLSSNIAKFCVLVF